MELITDFIRYLKTERRCSPHTLSAYTLDLKSFEEFISLNYDTPDLLNVDRSIVRAFMSELKNQGLNNRSVNRKLSSLKSFYTFLETKQRIKHNPLSLVKMLKTAKNLPEFVPESILETYNSAEAETFSAARDQIIFEILYQTGIRRAELCNLRDEDIDFSAMTIKVHGKRNKERLIPFTIKLEKMIKSYYKMRNTALKAEHFETTIVTNKGKKCYAGLVYRSINAQLNKLSNISKASPHVLRHTFATHLLNSGADLLAIKELLGHTSLVATQVYTHSTIDKLKEIHKQAHPSG